MALDPQAEFIINAIVALDDDVATKVITDTLTLRPEVAPIVVNRTCPDLTYAPASSMTSRRSAGIVKTQVGSNGFGFLACPEIKLIFGQDVYVHKDQLGDLTPGTEVNFAVLLSKDMKPQAFDIQPGHEGASNPSPVNASHLAAAKLLAPKSSHQSAPAPPPPMPDIPQASSKASGGPPMDRSYYDTGGKGDDQGWKNYDNYGPASNSGGNNSYSPWGEGKGKGKGKDDHW